MFRKNYGTKKKPISRNITGEYNTSSSPPEVGYYKIVPEVIDGQSYEIPVLISPGWQIDGDFLTGQIDYNEFALKKLDLGPGSLDK